MDIKKRIQMFRESMDYKMYIWGEEYYRGNNTLICERQKYYYDTTYQKQMCDPYKANHKLPSGFFKKIVDQKVQYLLGNGLFSEHKDKLNDLTGDIDEYLIDLGTTASKKSLAWSHLFIDDGNKKVFQVPTEQIIAIYNSKGELALVIRFYITTEVMDGEFIELHMAEIWDAETVETWIKVEDKYQRESVEPHVIKSVNFNGATVEQESNAFGYVPYIPLYNNKEHDSDLKNIIDFIDIYDITNSDFANNIDDMQDAYYIIKNFQGQDLEEFLSQLKKDKVVQVGEDGDVDSKQMVIPTEARTKFLDMTHKNIFEFSMSVDTKNASGGSLTNVAIKSMYADLDLKTDQFEMQVKKHLNKLLWIIDPNLEPDWTFERSLIINEAELLKANVGQKGSISEKTRLDNHAWVQDTEEEMELMEKEQEEMLDSMNFDPIEDEDEEGEK